MTKHEKKVTSSRIRRFAVAVISALMAVGTVAAPAPAQAAAPSATVCRWYVVRRGDTLGDLAIRYRTDVLALRRANGLRTTRIFIGQRLCIPTVVAAPRPSTPGTGTSTGPWTAEYWNNAGQSGSPTVARTDAAVNFDWGFGSPDPARVFADNFSARWTRSIAFTAGVWRFGVQADDGFRLYVDGNLVMDFIGYEGNQSRAVDVAVPAGTRSVRIDYVEKSGQALIKFNYFKVSGGSAGSPAPSADWSAEYFSNTTLGGSPVRVGRVNELNFNWGAGSPAPIVPRDNWSARFVQYRSYVGGPYRIVAQVDDGIRVYVDDVLVMNEWREQSYRTFVADVNLAPGFHTIRVEYLEVGAQAALRVYLEKL